MLWDGCSLSLFFFLPPASGGLLSRLAWLPPWLLVPACRPGTYWLRARARTMALVLVGVSRDKNSGFREQGYTSARAVSGLGRGGFVPSITPSLFFLAGWTDGRGLNVWLGVCTITRGGGRMNYRWFQHVPGPSRRAHLTSLTRDITVLSPSQFRTKHILLPSRRRALTPKLELLPVLIPDSGTGT